MNTLYKIIPATILATTLLFTGCDKQKEAVAPSGVNGSSDAKAKTKMDAPTVTSATATQTSIDVTVTTLLNSSGAPAGFSLQWMKASDLLANGNVWYASEDPRLSKASFSGNANASDYNLKAGEAVTVRVGDFLFDNGASTSNDQALTCGTAYVFRVFAHATSTLMRSDFTANQTLSTLDCGTTGPCTHGFGYWKGHFAQWPARVIANGLMVGSKTYTAAQLLSILNQPSGGNGLVTLAHQLITAKLNLANGLDSSSLATAIAAADAAIGTLVIAPVGTGSQPAKANSALYNDLHNYNAGGSGQPGNCDGE